MSKTLYERLLKKEPLFKSAKEIEWALEILSYGLIPPHSQFIRDDQNHLQNILTIYELILCEETERTIDKQTNRYTIVEVINNSSSF